MNRNDVIKGLQCCSQGRNGADAECGSCPYIENTLECKETLAADALEYIQRSEEARADLVERMDELLATMKDMPDVVRCRECKHYEIYNSHYGRCNGRCIRHSILALNGKFYSHSLWTNEDDYCSCGERKEKDE